jgi:hypothetical protein
MAQNTPNTPARYRTSFIIGALFGLLYPPVFFFVLRGVAPWSFIAAILGGLSMGLAQTRIFSHYGAMTNRQGCTLFVGIAVGLLLWPLAVLEYLTLADIDDATLQSWYILPESSSSGALVGISSLLLFMLVRSAMMFLLIKRTQAHTRQNDEDTHSP